jgi:hypothetical protein
MEETRERVGMIGVDAMDSALLALEMMRQTGRRCIESLAKNPQSFREGPAAETRRNMMNKDIPLACDLARLYGWDLPSGTTRKSGNADHQG